MAAWMCWCGMLVRMMDTPLISPVAEAGFRWNESMFFKI